MDSFDIFLNLFMVWLVFIGILSKNSGSCNPITNITREENKELKWSTIAHNVSIVEEKVSEQLVLFLSNFNKLFQVGSLSNPSSV